MRYEKVRRKIHKPLIIRTSKSEGDRKVHQKRTLAEIEKENERKRICLNCKKSTCNGVCEIFKN